MFGGGVCVRIVCAHAILTPELIKTNKLDKRVGRIYVPVLWHGNQNTNIFETHIELCLVSVLGGYPALRPIVF